MKMLILEGPDNLGKSTAITQMKQVLNRAGHKVHVLRFPDRSDWSEALAAYAMGHSTAISIERQYLITMNCMVQYTKIPKDTDIVLCDRHHAVSNHVYFRDTSDAAEAFRDAVRLSTLKMHEALGIDYTCCMLLIGDQPFVEPDKAEHFEVSGDWIKLRDRYQRLNYTKTLVDQGMESCAIDAFSAKGKLVDIIAGLFAYALKHGALPQPLNAAIHTPENEGEKAVEGVPPTEKWCDRGGEGCDGHQCIDRCHPTC